MENAVNLCHTFTYRARKLDLALSDPVGQVNAGCATSQGFRIPRDVEVTKPLEAAEDWEKLEA